MSIELVQICGACPESYDAVYMGDQVGYLRLRHGRFTVECPDAGGNLVYEARPNGDGIFCADEREFYLDKAKEAIMTWIGDE